ncbi:E3 ubiquitin-protein ligase TRIM37 isoform X1 [Folsomia candida]|uniref:E3 ubiquitin-protein ligase TRIM37 isoform X1 n=1 Tax=Folsomia candida TaxID=158441 RepID=UPI001604A327|nr:E3 ubiquitin-protein ligase TRIM37 isoform X1 [Folsomia candida]
MARKMSLSKSNANSHKDNQMESIQEIFRCFICMENLRDARMCPRCSKLCCKQCIQRWLSETRPQCPHCRAALHIHDLVNCRWAEEVTQQLDNLQSNPAKGKCTPSDDEPETEKCETHVKEELSVYCETCKCCICHECALWSTKHSNHVFKPLEEIYLQHCHQIREHVGRLRKRFMELIGAVQEIEKNIETVRGAKDQKVREIRQAVELMIARLDNQLKMKLTILVGQKGQFSRQAEELEGILHSIESTITSGPKSELILHSSKLVKLIQDGINRSTFIVPGVSGEFQSELVPPYDGATFVVNNYSHLRELADPFYSDPLHANGLTWRLKIYPDGNGAVRGTFLSVFLELTSGPADSAKSSSYRYEYRIEMVYQHANEPSKNMIREFASDFEINECWGYNRFFRIDLLESEGYLDPITDTIRLKFDARSPTYFLKCKDQQWYISELERKTTQQAQAILDLSQRVEKMEAEMPLGDGNLANNADLNITAGSEESTGKQSHNRSRLQMIELLDLNDNNDTEETASEENSDESEMEDQENEAGGDTSEVEVVEFTGDDINLNDAYEGYVNYFALMDELTTTTPPPRPPTRQSTPQPPSGSQ